MVIHIAPVILHIRIYDDSINVDKPLYAMTEPYNAHIIAVINDLGTARIEGFVGYIDVIRIRDIAKALKKYGVKRAEWRHNNIEKHLNLVSNKHAFS